ncbi:MAG: hypothetical protein ACI8QD_001088 [Cyclobacteriaceae bacterium]|jgi:hypothetical protein
MIVDGTSYEPSYRAVTYLNKLLSESDALLKINEDKENLVATLNQLATHAGELNT